MCLLGAGGNGANRFFPRINGKELRWPMFSSYTVGESAALISPAVICERINGERERERERRAL